MVRIIGHIFWLGLMAGLGVIIGCWIHGSRVNQTTVMSGVAFVRSFPYGEHVVGALETTVFSYQERQHLKNYKEKYGDQIKIDPKVLERHRNL